MITTLNNEQFSSANFWEKTSKYSGEISKDVLCNALKMYYSANDKETPTWAKTTLTGALFYFITPVDAIPDITPMLGYSDDATVLVVAIATTAAHINENHVERARQTLIRWFG